MSTTHFNFFKEKLILQEEEKHLKKMLEKFQDQLNRLKIEELALISMMKMDKEKTERGESMMNSNPSSRNAVSVSSRTVSSVTSSDMNDYIIPVGIVSEDASTINRETLDLNVGPSLHVRAATVGKDDMEMEEEEESDEEEKDANAMSVAESQQLMSFMEDF